MAVVPVGVSTGRVFQQVVGESPYMGDLVKIFDRILTPLYGSQADALNKIKLGKDRTCYLLYENSVPVGVIAFKTVLSDEFAIYGIKRSIEIKSLFVVDSESNSGRGIGSVLLNKAVEEADKLKLSHEALHVTVSETKNESLTFFKRKGFVEKFRWVGRYIKDVTEYLLAAPPKLPTPQEVQGAAKIIALVSPPPAAAFPEAQRPFSPKVAFWVPNAHWDDIHELKLLSDGTFISGSKDNCIVKWDMKGNLVRVVSEVEPDLINERNWITAMGIINDSYWASGERNGRVSLWTTEGEFVKNYNVKLPKFGHVSHEYNKRRVNCLAAGVNRQKPSIFVGFPTMFDEFNIIEGRTVSSTDVHANDWVFCIQALTEKRVLVATACVLDVFDKVDNKWSRTKTLVEEGPKIGKQRPFISSLTPLKSSPAHYGLGIFGGQVKVLDVEQGKIVRAWQEHRKRVWAVENISRDLFASSAEDKTIKLWDARADKSIASLDTPNGQAHALLSPNETMLIAGVSQERRLIPPKNAKPQEKNKSVTESAHLYFYDLRK